MTDLDLSTLRPVSADDVTPNTRRGGDMRLLISPRTVQATSGLTGVLTLDPGDFVAEHYHPYSEEHIFIIAGELLMRVEGTPVTLGPGQAFSVPISLRHRLENTGTERGEVIFHLSPLAPEPRLGHVETEQRHPDPAAPPDGGR